MNTRRLLTVTTIVVAAVFAPGCSAFQRREDPNAARFAALTEQLERIEEQNRSLQMQQAYGGVQGMEKLVADLPDEDRRKVQELIDQGARQIKSLDEVHAEMQRFLGQGTREVSAGGGLKIRSPTTGVVIGALKAGTQIQAMLRPARGRSARGGPCASDAGPARVDGPASTTTSGSSSRRPTRSAGSRSRSPSTRRGERPST